MEHNSGSSSNSWNDNLHKVKRDLVYYNRSISTESSSSDKVSDMSDMFSRLTTYDTWPDDVVTSATELTRCGLFYTGYKDEVRCCDCGVKLQNWKMEDVPYERHKHASPKCKFLLKIPRYVNGASNFSDFEDSSNNGHGNGAMANLNKSEKVQSNISSESLSMGQKAENCNNSERSNLNPEYSIQNGISGSTGNPPEVNGWFTPRQNVNSTNNTDMDYTIETNRVLSFAGNWQTDAPVTAQELVNAGFYFTGPGDRVQCAWCKGGLYNFEEGDSAIGEHIRHFPECHFIKTKMYEMMHVRMSDPGNSQQRNTNADPVHNQWRNDTHVNSQQRNTNADPVHNQWRNDTHVNNDADITQIPVVHIVTEMGYDMDSIKKAIRNSGIPVKDISSEELIDALYDLENSEQYSPKIPIENELLSIEEDKTSNVDQVESENLDQLMEENERLKGKTICKVCLDKAVDTLFLPCRHLVCCEKCAEAVQQCPVCRTVIVGTVQTFMS